MKESNPLVAARPARPIAAYIGGKRNLAERVIGRLRHLRHDLYAEPFVGMGGIFFRRPFKAPAEVINDLSRDVATTMRILQRHYVPFMEMLRWQLTSRAEFERLMAIDADTLTDLERAARFIYLQRTAFGGKVVGRNFGVSYGPARFDVTKLAPLLEAAHDRLAGVTIECLPWAAFIARYDRRGTLFYLDPPYWGSEEDYGRSAFGREQFAELAATLAAVKGRFLLSINDVPEIRRLFRGCSIEPVATTYTLSGHGRTKPPRQAKELLITGPSRRVR